MYFLISYLINDRANQIRLNCQLPVTTSFLTNQRVQTPKTIDLRSDDKSD